MSLVTIKADKRSMVGKGYSRQLRSQGKIPGNIIGKGQSTPIELDSKLLPKAWKGNNRVFELEFEGAKKQVQITELQIDPVKRYALHVDLRYLD